MQGTDRLEKTIKVSELFDYMREEGLVIVPRSEALKYQYKEKVLRKKFLTYKEIADAGLWGDIQKSRVEAIAKAEVQPHEIDKSGHTFRISRHAVERIGKNRGTL